MGALLCVTFFALSLTVLGPSFASSFDVHLIYFPCAVHDLLLLFSCPLQVLDLIFCWFKLFVLFIFFQLLDRIIMILGVVPLWVTMD